MAISSLADALFTATQQKVLGVLFGQPDRSFFVTQIMELANAGRGAVQRELERLRQGGLVTVRNVGTQKHFQANPDSPLFDELCGIVQKTVGLAYNAAHALCLAALRHAGYRSGNRYLVFQCAQHTIDLIEE